MDEAKSCPRCEKHFELNEPSRSGDLNDRDAHHCHHKGYYDKLDTENKIIMNLRGLGHTIRFSAEGKGSQGRILLMLMKFGNMTQKELVNRMEIQPGSASEVLIKLENAGLIVRTENGDDRRVVDVSLTEEGRVKAQEAAERRKVLRSEMLAALSQEEKDTLLGLLEKLNAEWRVKYGKGHEHHHRDGHHEHN